jgi:hypothetical protein
MATATPLRPPGHDINVNIFIDKQIQAIEKEAAGVRAKDQAELKSKIKSLKGEEQQPHAF